jgi:crossover junction endodeoxyribonuclease RuvC
LLVLGVDPGTAILGYGLVRQDGPSLTAVDYGVLTTPASLPLPRRLAILHSGLAALIDRYHPDAASVEQLFFTKNVRTAIAVSHARGVVLLAIEQAGLPVYEYTPLRVKQAVLGYGRGDKVQMQTMVRMLLGLPSPPQPDDAADALAIAICHLNLANYTALTAPQAALAHGGSS